MRANEVRSIGKADWVWRNWQLGERAHPVGEKASSTRRRNKENFERSEKGDYVSSGHAGAVAKNKFNMRVWRNWQTR